MPLELSSPRTISDRALTQRLITRVLSFCAGILLLAGFASGKGWIPTELTGPLLLLLFAVGLAAAWSGWRAHHYAIADRETMSGGAMLIALAAQLGRQDDETLEQIRARGGPAGDAAGLILRERKVRATRTGG